MNISRSSMDLRGIFHRPPQILIADDDWLNRDLLKAYLTSSGCEVVTAADGESALEIARQQPLDLALLDVQMPRMDGMKLCATLKGAPETRFMPIVIVTALDSEEEKMRAIEVGADDFITKPYNSLVLLTRVRSLLRIKMLHDEVQARNRLLRQVLDRFIAEDVTDIILTDPERYLQLGGDLRYVTVLFADIRSFSSYTEKYAPAKVIKTLNRIFQELSQVIFTYHGTFDKYLGDGLMAFYGAPLAGEDDAQRAVDSAIEMQRRFRELCRIDAEAMQDLGLGIGLHSGEAIVGNIGSDKVMDYTVIGDVVVVAKRLQENAASGQILVSHTTFEQIKGVKAVKLEPVQVKGREEFVTAHLIDANGAAS
ncbi:MAG: response regulator [Anaerolineales bacterium]|nr:response regulator [Anaerolineales bacterium]